MNDSHPDFTNATIRSTHPDDLNICPGGINCDAPDECSDCNPDQNAFTTGACIAAAAKAGLQYLADSELRYADNSLDVLDDLDEYCAHLPTKEALHDVVRGVIYMLKLQHQEAARNLYGDPDPSTDAEPTAHHLATDQAGEGATSDPWGAPHDAPRVQHLRLVHSDDTSAN